MPLETYLLALSRIVQPIRKAEWNFDLEPMRALLAALDNPQQRLNAVVVTGSSGKGSTCARMAQLLGSAGLNVGLYTSPHLHSFRERIVYSDEPISQDDFVAGAEIVLRAAAQLDHTFSTFESTTALALWYFARQQPDIAVLETGLGGRYDAVNVVANKLAVFSRIELEHAAILGGTLERIAWHKAGIIQAGGQALSVVQVEQVEAALREEAIQQQASLEFVTDEVLVRRACQILIERGLVPLLSMESAVYVPGLPGRLEQLVINWRQLLIDGGHTPYAAAYLRREIERLLDDSSPVTILIGLLDDKQAVDYLKVFDAPRFRLILTRPPGHRGADPEVIAAQLRLREAQVEIEPDLDSALNHIRDDIVTLFVVAGSLRLAARAREAYGLLDAAELAEAQATRALFEGESYLGKLGPQKPETEE